MPKEKIVAVGKGGYGILFHAKERLTIKSQPRK